MAAIPQISRLQPANLPIVEVRPAKPGDRPESAQSFRQVFRGRELTLKTRRIESGLEQVDRLIDGGIVRGRISEIIGPTGAGKTSLAMAFAATVTRVEAAAWIEACDSLDPASMRAAGVEPARMLWVSCGHPHLPRRRSGVATFDDNEAVTDQSRSQNKVIASLKTAEWILAAGGFGLVVIDFGQASRFIPASGALRLARAAERSGAALIVLADQRMCGTFAVLSLELSRRRAHFNRIAHGADATFDGQALEARVIRNKLGGAGGTALWSTAADPHGEFATPRGSARPSADDRARNWPATIVAGAPV